MRNNKPSADPRSGKDFFQRQLDESPLFRELHELLKEDWNNLSLNMIDKFIAKNWQSLKCSDIAEMYFKFFDDLKEIKGNSTQFTGFSEFLILRSLLHQLDAAGKRNKDEDKRCFKSKHPEGLFVETDLQIQVNGGSVRPDITIYDSKSKDIKGIIEVKICLQYKKNSKDTPATLQTAKRKLKKVYDKHKSAKMLLLIFDEEGKTKEESYSPSKSITLSNLRGNGKLICELFKESLAIG